MPHYGIKMGFEYHFKLTWINPCLRVMVFWLLLCWFSLLRRDFVLRHGEQWCEFFPEVWIWCLIHLPHPQHCLLLWCVYFRRSFYIVLILCLPGLYVHVCFCVVCAVWSIRELRTWSPLVHRALQIPQYFLITIGEVMFSVTACSSHIHRYNNSTLQPDWLQIQRSHWLLKYMSRCPHDVN